MRKIFTIGYGDKDFEEFTKILKENGIEQVIDVRHFPTSKWPEYKKGKLEENLTENRVEYHHLEDLGGYRDEGYSNYAETKEFKRGLEKLTVLAEEKKTVIMCLESLPSSCHRRFIANKLEERGWDIIHLVGKKGRILK